MQVHVLKVKPFPVRRSLSTPAGAERVWLAVSKQSSSMHACSKEVRSPANLTVTLRVSITGAESDLRWVRLSYIYILYTIVSLDCMHRSTIRQTN